MYEELVNRLRIAAQLADKGIRIPPSLCLEAADAIERLAKEKEFLSEQVAHWQSETVKTDCEVWLAENGKPHWMPLPSAPEPLKEE